MYLKNTYKKLSKVGFMIVKGLRQELKDQQHNATHKLSNSLKPKVKGKSGVMDIITSKLYWKAVNNPAFAKPASLKAIESWVKSKGSKGGFPNSPESIKKTAILVYNKLKNKFYGKPYVYWTEGNNLKRTDFAGHTARKLKGKVAEQLAPAIGQDVADMIRKAIKKNIPKAKTI
mgnify:FL=1|jgi:hypothetical protein